MTPAPDSPNEKEGRIARHSRLAREALEQPSSVVHWSRNWLVRLWITKGGGFYGLGYVITFVSLEIRSLSGDLTGSDSVSGFVTSQGIQLIIRFSIESFLNAISALIWPVHLLQWLSGLGLVVLVAAYVGYRYTVFPLIETWVPEIREARETKAARKAARRKARQR